MKAQDQVFHYFACIDCRWVWNPRSTSGEERLWLYQDSVTSEVFLWCIMMILRGLCMSLILSSGSSYIWIFWPPCVWPSLFEMIRLINIGKEGRKQGICMEIFLTCLQQAHHWYHGVWIGIEIELLPIMKQVLLLNLSWHNMILWEISMWLLQVVTVDHKFDESAMK